MSENKPIQNESTVKLDGATYVSMVVSAANAIDNQKEQINDLNVFPVPDGDTGSNMSMTMSATRRELSDMSGSLSECADKVASMCLRSARGNSGVILSLFFRGLAKGFKGMDTVDAVDILHAFQQGVDEAYKAVQYPTEGTILTVMRACVDTGLQKAVNSDYGVENLFDYMVEVADATLKKTPEMLPVLKQANVVDAGGAGFLAILDGMRAALKNQPVRSAKETAPERAKSADFSIFETENIVNPYCTECIVTKSPEYAGEGTVDAFRQFVLSAGDSAVFVDDSEIIKVHVHTKDPGSVLSEALKYGTLYTVKVENMKNQHTQLVESESAPAEEKKPRVAPAEKQYGFVAVTPGDGIKNVFADLGVDHFVHGGQTMNPSTEQLLDAVLATPSEIVYLLPNNSNICLVANQCSKLCEEKTVIVIPTVSTPQGVAAMMAFNPEETPDENSTNMTSAASNVLTLDMTFAARNSEFDGQTIREGQILGLVNHKVTYISDTRDDCMDKLTEHMRDASFVTLFYGEDVTEQEAEAAAAHLQEVLGDDVEVSVLPGGQPLYYYIISVE
ncbi:MAG: DAK2 domain-containing protein [Eubacteriales bacterium]